MRITFTGIKRAVRDLGDATEDEIWNLADFAESSVKRYTAVDTGNARAGWNLTKDRNGFILENRVPYIQRLDQGWSNQQPRGFTSPTLNAIKRRRKKK